MIFLTNLLVVWHFAFPESLDDTVELQLPLNVGSAGKEQDGKVRFTGLQDGW